MGSELRRQLREALGPDIKGLQRAVALELADDARWDDEWNYDAVKGRRSKARLSDLVRWTAAKDELSVREMLRRLSVAGWEFRLPIGKGKDGRLLYAVPGVAMQFRVPDFDVPAVEGFSNEGVATAGPEQGPTTVGPIDPTSVGPSDQGPTVVGEGPTTVGEGPTVVGEGPTVVGSPSLVSPCSSRKESPSTSSVAEVEPEVLEGEIVEEGGGGGGDSIGFIQRAEAFVAALDYRGKPPGQTRRAKLCTRVVAAFKAGWTEQTLADYLDVSNDPSVRNPAAVYDHRLKGDELPEPPTPLVAAGRSQLPPPCAECFDTYREAAEKNLRLRVRDGKPCPDCHPGSEEYRSRHAFEDADDGMWGRAMARARARNASGNWQGTGTDDRVAGWMALAADLTEREAMLNGPTRPSTTDQRVQQAIDAGQRMQARQDAQNGYQPYSNNGWDEMNREAANGLRPDGADDSPHCGECDEYSRTRGPDNSPCSRCHPMLRF